MNPIESSVIINPTSDNADGRGAHLRNRHAWLNSLEQAGLINALRETKMIEADKGIAPDKQPKEVATVVNAIALTERESLQLPIRRKSLPNDLDTIQVKTDTASLRIEKPSLRMQDASLALSGQKNHIGDFEVIKPELVKMLSGLITTRQPYEWALKNMVALRSSEGLEVWVRDANMDGLKIVDFLKGLRQSIGDLGISLVKVVVNGKEMFSAQQSSNSINL